MNRMKKLITLMFLGVIMAEVIVSCEQEDKYVGADIVGDQSAKLNKKNIDVTAYTIGSDTLRSDRGVLQNITLGVYDEPLFGKAKSSFYTQVRLTTLNPDFGENPTVDSIVLVIPTLGFKDSKDTLSITRNLLKKEYTLGEEEEACAVIDTTYRVEILRKFKVDSIKGNNNMDMTLQVHKVTERMGVIDTLLYSDKEFSVGELFGAGTISSSAYTREVTDLDNIDDDSDDGDQESSDTYPTYRIKLNDAAVNFFQSEIVDNAESSNLGDQASFVNNVLNGLRLSVAEDDGFQINLSPSAMNLVMYYSFDNSSFEDENGNGINDDDEDCPAQDTFSRADSYMSFSISNSYNVYQSYVENEQGTITLNDPSAQTLYIEGLGGAGAILELDETSLLELRENFQENEWAITEAHFKIYPDTNTQGDLSLPSYLHLYNYDDKTLLDDYGDETPSGAEDFQGFPFNQISLAYNEEDGYYLLRCTEYIKNIVEKNHPIDRLYLGMGNYIWDQSSYFYVPKNAYFSQNVFVPNRLAIVSSTPDASLEDKKLQLEVFYNTKELN